MNTYIVTDYSNYKEYTIQAKRCDIMNDSIVLSNSCTDIEATFSVKDFFVIKRDNDTPTIEEIAERLKIAKHKFEKDFEHLKNDPRFEFTKHGILKVNLNQKEEKPKNFIQKLINLLK